MKTKNQMKPLARFIAASLAVGSIAGFGAQAFAQTAAGTLIKNLATVSYEDENGNTYSAQSNEAVVTVAPVYSATIESDNDLLGAPGTTVYFPHILSNTGNIADTFTVAADLGGIVYLDTNNNGQPDAGEVPVTSVTVPAGEQVNLVVSLAVPGNAAGGTSLTTTLTTTSANGTVVDETTGKGTDGLDETNEDTVTVSTGPVLVTNKSSVHDEATNTITYTLTVKNTGASAATNVYIVDAIPEVDANGDGTLITQLPVTGTLGNNGLINADDSLAELSVTEVSGTGLSDINFDGDSADTLNTIYAKDASLPANTTVSISYSVTYPPTYAADVEINNTFLAFEDLDTDGDGDPSTIDPSDPPPTVVGSNTVTDIIPQTYGVTALDTNTVGPSGGNDGGDDDAAALPNDIQYVDVAGTGSKVLFKHVITNTGNGDDIFDINVANNTTGGFPPNTVFTYWDSTGSIQLTDTDNDGIPDTGVLGAGADTTIMVKADLPAGFSGTAGYNATLTATSTSAPAADPKSDVTNLRLGSITEASLDIANVIADQGLVGFNVADGLVNAQDEAPVVLKTTAVGGIVKFDLHLANESGNPDSYLLSSANVPSGWSVVYKDALTGNVITTTPLIPGGGTPYAYTAEVTVSSDPAKALSDSDQAGAVNGYDAIDNGAPALTTPVGDTDNDYFIDFIATSTSTPTLNDTVRNAIDVDATREVVITPNGQNQVQPGGTVTYSHQLENNGNQDELVEMKPTNTQPGWTTVINVDTTGDGIPDTILTNALAGTQIWGTDANGNPVQIDVTSDGDLYPELDLKPGVNVNMTTTVTAPSNAPLGATDLSTINVTEANDAPLTSAEDQTTVMLGQVRLDKSAAIDTNCDGAADPGATFLAVQTAQVKPGECIVWRLMATNDGTATVKNVVISDAAPDFTEFMTPPVVGAMKFCQTLPCTPATVTEASDTDNGTYSAGLVKFFAKNGASTPASGVGGELKAGEVMIGEFTVRVQ